MAGLLSDRVGKTDQVVVLPASVDSPPGLYRVTLLTICASILALFTTLVIAYLWRMQSPPYWASISLPRTLWLSTALILASSATCEEARRLFGRGYARRSSPWMVVTATLGAAFLASQLTAWRQLAAQGAFLAQNPHSSFFYLFTAAHGAHLVGGLAALFVLLFRQNKRRELVDTISVYWHFLGALWIVLFAVLLLS